MVEYTKGQEMVARALLDSPKRLDEIREKTNLDAVDLNEALKGLIQLRVVELKDDKYKLMDIITNTLSKKGSFEANFMIEGISSDREVLKQRMKVMEEKIRLKIRPLKIEMAKPVENEKMWSMFIEFNAQFRDLHSLVDAIINYGPSSVELLKPEKAELDQYHLQSLISDITSAVHYYASVILNATLLLQKSRNEVILLQNELAKTLQKNTEKAPKNSTSKATKKG